MSASDVLALAVLLVVTASAVIGVMVSIRTTRAAREISALVRRLNSVQKERDEFKSQTVQKYPKGR
jgi:hypothetical protein